MSILRHDDAHLHYHDGSHRWIASHPENDAMHRAHVLMHLAEHQRLFGHEPVRRSPRDAPVTSTRQEPRTTGRTVRP